ncbi:MAG: nucleotidyltransferase family protein [Pirellulaceae bacterium]|jgi:glucose-1-phosphate cytidylyltransferase|nr:nucleotidyltransferase family protein [Pirellulaceae bacterium]
MKIAIMCGGRGKRLGRLTEMVPKPLVELNGQTILERKIEAFVQQGFCEFIFCTGYKGDLIEKAVHRFHSKADLQFSSQGSDVGILARLHAAQDLYEEQVMLTYGDTYTDLDLTDLIEQHQQTAHEATIVTAPVESPFGLVEFDQTKKALLFEEKPTLNYYIGQAVVNKSSFACVSPEVLQMPDGQGLVTYFKTLIEQEQLGVYHHAGLDITFNTQEELTAAEQKLLRFYTAAEEHHEE